MKPDQDTLTAYTLGLLDGPELQAVEAYLNDHPDVAAEVRADHEALAAFALSLPPAEVPSGSEERLLARLRREDASRGFLPEPPVVLIAGPEAPASPAPVQTRDSGPDRSGPVTSRPPQRSWWPLAFAAALALVTVLAWPSVQSWQTQQALRSYQNQAGAVTHQLQAEGGRRLGTLVRLTDGRTFVVLDAEPQAGRVYQAWAVADGQAVSLGVFKGRQILTEVAPGAAFAVSVEPPGGSPQPTSTPIVVQPL